MLRVVDEVGTWRGAAKSVPVRVLLSLLMALVAYQAGRTAVADFSRQDQESRMEQFQKPGGGDVPSLVASAQSLQDYPVAGAFSDIRGDAYSMARYHWIRTGREGDPPLDPDLALSEYQRALMLRPRDGYLWARYGLYLSSLDTSTHRGNALGALDRAMALSPRDYITMRLVADIGVRFWHELTCPQRTRLMAMLDRAADVDDSLLNQWITQLGQPPMQSYLDNLFGQYGFNPRWARASVAACNGEA